MIKAIKNLLGIKSADLSALIKNGAIIVDVRSKSEFEAGHAKGAINISVEQIDLQVGKLKKNSHIYNILSQ